MALPCQRLRAAGLNTTNTRAARRSTRRQGRAGRGWAGCKRWWAMEGGLASLLVPQQQGRCLQGRSAPLCRLAALARWLTAMCARPAAGCRSPQIQAANPISRSLFNTAYRSKLAALQASAGALGCRVCCRASPPRRLGQPATSWQHVTAPRPLMRAASWPRVQRGDLPASHPCCLLAVQRGDLSGGRLGPFWDRLVFSKIKARVGGERDAPRRHPNVPSLRHAEGPSVCSNEGPHLSALPSLPSVGST